MALHSSKAGFNTARLSCQLWQHCLMAFSHSPALGYWSSSAAAEETQSYGHGRARVTDEAEILIFFFVVVQKGDVIALGLQFLKV